MNFKRHNIGMSFIEVIIALAFFALVCGILLVTQRRSVATGMRAINEQLVVNALLNKFIELDRIYKTTKIFCAEQERQQELTPPAPVGTITCSTSAPRENSQAHKYPRLQQDVVDAAWMHEGREMRTKLVRFRFDTEVLHEEE